MTNREWNRIHRENKLRRAKQLMFYKALLCVAFILFVATLLTLSVKAASSRDQKQFEKRYTNIYVNAGDTLSDLVEEYALQLPEGHNQNDYYDEILYMNHIVDADHIQSGDYIIVPYYVFTSSN